MRLAVYNLSNYGFGKWDFVLVKRALLRSLSDVDLRLLRVFDVVAECNGIAASEMELNISKSTISRHISDLEQRIGLRLCNRGPSGFSLTHEGEQVLKLTHSLMQQIDEFQVRLDGIQSTLKGSLRIGIFDQSSTNPNANLHHAIALFDESAPEVAINISLETPATLETAVAAGELDLAIIPHYQPTPSLLHTRLYKERMSLYCGPGHPLFGKSEEELGPGFDLTRYKYAGYSFNSPNMRAGSQLGLIRSAKVKEEEALAVLIQSGRYIGYLANHVAEGLNRAGDVWPILPNETSYEIDFVAIRRRRPAPDRKTLVFLECLTEAHKA